MSAGNPLPLPVIGSEVTTACGTAEKYKSDTPRVFYEEKLIFFCTAICQQEFIQDPRNSCMADQLMNPPSE
jgi:hypothetical protein